MRYITIIILLTFLFGCKPKGINDTDKRNENWCWFVDKKTKEGKWVPVKNETNLPDGDYTLFYSNGEIRITGKLKDNKDCDTIYYYNLSRKVVCKRIKLTDSLTNDFMSDGKDTVYYKTCEIEKEGEYKDNKEIGKAFEFYENGKIMSEYIPKHDSLTVMRYYESGNPKDSLFLINEKAEGIRKMWYDNGKLKEINYYINDIRNGLHIGYYENGNIYNKCYFKNELVNGSSVFYYENSIKKSEAYYKDGKRDGMLITYFENGLTESKVNYTNGVCNGENWFYYPNGKLKHFYINNMGVITSYISYDENGNLLEEKDVPNTFDYPTK